MTICVIDSSMPGSSWFSSPSPNAFLDYIMWSQTSLSQPLILSISAVLTAVWTYLWYSKAGYMRSKRVQTWWQLGGYTVLFLLGTYRAYAEGLHDILFRIHEAWHYPQLTNRGTVLYFELEIGWYLSCLVCTLINNRAKDFRAMLFHHIITPVEVYFAYQCGYTAITVVILVLHDTSDVFLHLAKTFHNEKWTKSTDTTFTIFAVVFFFTRLVFLPMCPWAYFFHNAAPPTTCGTVLSVVCFVLVGLHAYWFYLIVQMIIKFARAGKVEGDIRDEELDEEEYNKRLMSGASPASPSKSQKSKQHPYAELAKR